MLSRSKGRREILETSQATPFMESHGSLREKKREMYAVRPAKPDSKHYNFIFWCCVVQQKSLSKVSLLYFSRFKDAFWKNRLLRWRDHFLSRGKTKTVLQTYYKQFKDKIQNNQIIEKLGTGQDNEGRAGQIRRKQVPVKVEVRVAFGELFN